MQQEKTQFLQCCWKRYSIAHLMGGHTYGGDLGDRRDSQVQGILAPHVDLGCKGSKEGMVGNAVLHHQRRIGLDN
jgi:hypothetical protein